jgi:hypothetical protein
MKNISKEEIWDANKYIAMFMDYEIFGNTVICGSGQRLHISEFNYHTDYRELMPVVDKINRRDWVTILANECKIHSLMVNEFETIHVIEEGCEEVKEPIWKAVSQYCKWFIIEKKTME